MWKWLIVFSMMVAVSAVIPVHGEEATTKPATAPAGAAHDSIADELHAEINVFKRANAAWRARVNTWLGNQEAVVRSKGDKAALDSILESKAHFEDSELPPEDAPQGLIRERGGYCNRMVTGYERAIKQYTRIRKDELANAVDADLAKFRQDYGLGNVVVTVPADRASSKYTVNGAITLIPDGKSRWNTSPGRWKDCDFRGHLDHRDRATNGMHYMALCYRVNAGPLVQISGKMTVQLKGTIEFGPSDLAGGGDLRNNTGSISLTVQAADDAVFRKVQERGKPGGIN